MVPPSLTEFSIQGGAFKIKPNDWIGMNFNPTGGLSLDAVEQAGGFKIDQLKLNGHGDLPTHNFLGTDGNNYSTTIAQFEVSFKSSSSQSAPELPTPLKILVPLTYNNTNAVVACGTQYNENISELRSCIYQFSGGGDTNWRKCPIENQILIGCVGAGNPSLGNIDTSNAGYIGVAPSRMNGDYPTACRARADTGGGVNVTVWLFCMTNAPNC